MLDAAYIREHLDAVKANCVNRNVKADVERVVQLDDDRKRLEQHTQTIQQRQNEVSKLIPKEKDAAAKQKLIAEGKTLREQVSGLEKQIDQVKEDLRAALVTIPNMTHPAAPIGTTGDPNKRQIYNIADTDLCLIATAEITLGGMHRDKIFDELDLPRKYVGFSHCFRTEAGAPGRDTKGLYRVHQFSKVEMFAFCTPDQSEAIHLELLRIEESIFEGLGLPYHVIDTCTGDLGGPAYRKYDLEAWMPGRGQGGEYGEVTSTSNCTDFQARRLNIRCKPKGGKARFAHTLNGTAVAVSRALVA